MLDLTWSFNIQFFFEISKFLTDNQFADVWSANIIRNLSAKSDRRGQKTPRDLHGSIDFLLKSIRQDFSLNDMVPQWFKTGARI